MANFDVSKEWAILVKPDIAHVNKAVEDISGYINLLAGLCGIRSNKPPAILDAAGAAPSCAVIVLNSDGGGPERNGFSWRAGSDRVEIYGESGRGLCNGIYSFLAALGISWPEIGKEKLPFPAAKNVMESSRGYSPVLTLTKDNANEPSFYEGSNPAAAPWKRFVLAGKRDIKNFLKNVEAFAAWAARRRYDALVFPLAAYASESTRRKLRQLRQIAGEYGIAVEAGGRELSSLVPRSYFFLHRDCFRMEEGKRKKANHFCPTNPGTIRLIAKEGEKLFRAAGDVKVFHLWPDKGAETTWCACPTCRAFTPAEQNRIGVNAAADVLMTVNSGASVTFYEKRGEETNIPLRKNLFKMEILPEEKKYEDDDKGS